MTDNHPLMVPGEQVIAHLQSDREVRFLTEALLAIVALPIGWTALWLIPGIGPDVLSITGMLSLSIGLFPAVAITAFRRRETYLLTTHRIAEVQGERMLWSIRFEQLGRVRRRLGTLILSGPNRSPHRVQNLRAARWLERQLIERAQA